jgi:hypothetical protein
MNTKSKIYILSIVIAMVLIFSPTGNVSKETLLLSNLSQTKPVDDFDSFDFFPDYHKEAQNICKVQKAKRILDEKKVLTGELNPEEAEWLSKNKTTPFEVLKCDLRNGA